MSLDNVMAMLQESAAKSRMRSLENQSFINNLMQSQADAQISMARAKRGGKSPYQSPVGGTTPDAGKVKLKGSKNLIAPLKRKGNWEFSSAGDFGDRTHPVHGGHSYHTGIDFDAPSGTPIYAVANGRVRAARNDSIYGNQVILGHGKRFQTMYGHMTNYTVRPGQRVRRGQIIGYVGSTGLSTGAHLHFETWKRRKPVNPLQFYRRYL